MEFLGFLLLALLFTHYSPISAETRIFVFGDSIADVGNNKYLPVDAEFNADHPYYGIDYPGGIPTGRFSNGYNGADCVAMHMGFNESPPAFLSLSSDVSKLNAMQCEGLNFASGGSGILNSTGTEGSSITMAQQIQYFADLRSKLAERNGTSITNSLLSKSIFLISAGGNDIIAFILQNIFSDTTEMDQFISNLTSNYVDHLKELYNLGARKFALIDVGPIGCSPGSRVLNGGSCSSTLNNVSLSFNEATKEQMSNLTSMLEGMKYSIGSSYAVISSIIDNPDAFGFKEVREACCGTGIFNAMSWCDISANCCNDRDHYLFWDVIHPTQATAQVASLAFYNGSLEFASPINFKQLVEDDNYESGLLLQPTKQYA